MANVLTVTGPRQLDFSHEDHERPLEPGEVRLRSVLSGVSHGTELSLYRGTSPFGDRTFDTALRAFVAGDGARASYPLRLGYEMVSHVVEAGPGVEHVAPGDLVHTGTPHQDWTIVDLREIADFGYPLTVLPAGGDPRPGLFVSLGSVALQAIHDALIKVGDAVAVSGLGLLVVQLAARNGADPIIALDPLPRDVSWQRRSEPPRPSIRPGCRRSGRWSRRRTRAAASTRRSRISGIAAALHGAIGSVAVGGRVVSVGFYQGDAVGLRLGEEWHHNRPTMVSSMGVWGCPHRDSPAWERQRLTDTVVDLIYSGALQTSPLISEIVAFDNAVDAYATIDANGQDVLKVGLAYPGSEDLVTEGALRAAEPDSAALHQ